MVAMVDKVFNSSLSKLAKKEDSLNLSIT